MRERRGGTRRVLGVVIGVLREAARVVLEVFVLLAEAWLALAELAGRLVHGAWLAVWPVALAAWRAGAAALRLAQRRVEPAHGTIAVTIAALVALAVSQFFDYRGISVGNAEYSGGVELVAPAPEVSREQTGDAHAWLVIPIAVAGLLALGLAVIGRRTVARLLVPMGAAVLAIAIFIDLPKGLDEGSASIAYEGARAALLEGFWVQAVAAGVLIVCGILLPIQLGALGGPVASQGGSSATRRGPARRRSRARAASA